MKLFIYKLLLLSFCLTVFSCQPEEDLIPSEYSYPWESHVPFKTNHSLLFLPFSDIYSTTPKESGEVEISEASGLAYSRKNPGMVWTHNDSGHTNSLFLLNANTGEIVAKYTIAGTSNIDWEDMEIAVDPEDGEPYIYVSDTGDNNEKRTNYTIYKFKEPYHSNNPENRNILLTDVHVERIRFKYPDGSHDTEAMFVDPSTKDIYLATKRDVVSFLYVIPYPQKIDEIYTIFKVGEFSFREASAGSVSADGNKIIIKNRQNIYYWEREEGELMFEALERVPLRLPYVGETQGEAICFDIEDNYYTLSEQTNSLIKPILYKYFKF